MCLSSSTIKLLLISYWNFMRLTSTSPRRSRENLWCDNEIKPTYNYWNKKLIFSSICFKCTRITWDLSIFYVSPQAPGMFKLVKELMRSFIYSLPFLNHYRKFTGSRANKCIEYHGSWWCDKTPMSRFFIVQYNWVKQSNTSRF